MHIERPVSKQPLPATAKRVFHGNIFDVYQWEQEGYDGTVKTFEKIKRPDTVMVIPVREDGKIILGKEEQPGKKVSLGTLGGRVDEGEDLLDAAKRELLEESGYESQEWSLFHALQPVSKLEWAVYVFVAKGCKQVADQHLDGAEKIDLVFVDFDTFVESITDEDCDDLELKVKFLEAKLDKERMEEYRKLLSP